VARGPADLFEQQYGERRLTYAESFPRLRRWLRPWLRDRFEVARDAVARLCATTGGHRLLDFGCGDGRLARLVAEAAPDAITEIVGVDISPSRVAQAQALVAAAQRGTTHFRFISGDESVLTGVRDKGFDIVMCIAVFGQVYDVYGLGRSLFESLRPGGYLVAEVANYAYVRHRARLVRGRVPTVSPAPMELWPSIGWDSGELHYFSRRTSVQFLTQIGFVVEAVHATGLAANALKIWPSLLATGFVIEARRPA
jgi:ubiquinone/menaquinone biosynthesis C-methylase UbiE